MRQPWPTALPLDFQLANDVVRLRALDTTDAQAVYDACRDPEIDRFTVFPQPRHVRETRAWIESQRAIRERGEGIDFGIVPAGGAAVVGAIGLAAIELEYRRAEVGYWIAPQMRRRGLASAALELISDWAMGPPLELVRLEAPIDVENLASRHTAERVGYRLDAVLRSYLRAKDRRWDVAVYSLLRGDDRRSAAS